MSPSRSELRARGRKLGLVCGSVLLALAFLYGVGVNALLATGELARLLSARPDKLRVEYAWARSWWPGLVRVEGLVVTGRDAHLEWQLRIDSANADISLASLLRRRFEVKSVTATGVTFRIRLRLEAKDATEDRIARIPPIPGLDPVPLLNPEDDASEDPSGHKPFTIALEDVDARAVREVWVDSFRLTGEMSAAGGFQLGPHQQLAVSPSRLLVRGATLATGDDVVFSDLSGAADATLDPVDLTDEKGEGRGTKVLRALTSHSGFMAKVGGIRFLRHFLGGSAKAIDLAGGDGTFDGLLVVERGIVKNGSRSHLELEPVRITVGGEALAARSITDVLVGEDDGGGWARGDVLLSSFTLSTAGVSRPLIASPSIALGAYLAEADLAEPPHDFTYGCDAPHVEIESLRWIDAALPPDGPFHIDGGRATVSLRGHGSREEATADLTLASSAAMRVDGAAATTAIAAKVRSHSRFDHHAIDLSGSEIELTGLAVRGTPARPDWWGKMKLESAEIGISPPSFGATIATSALDARPLLSLYSAMRDTSPAVSAALALVPSPLVESMTANLHGRLRLLASKQAIDLRALDVQGAQTRIRGELTKRGEAKEGALLFEAGPAAVGVSFEESKAGVVLVDAPRWFEGRRALP